MKKTNNRSSFLNTNLPGLVNNSSLASSVNITNTPNTKEIFIGEVFDIILDSSHPSFQSNNDNIGKIKFRLIEDDSDRDINNLSWAYPLQSTIKQFPVLHETVQIVSFFNKFFYTTINVNNNINNNAIPGISETGKKDLNENLNNYTNSKHIPNTSNDKNNIQYGNYFKENSSLIKQLKPNEGDLVIQGRFGTFMRIGSNPDSGMPIFKLGIGQRDDVNKLNKNDYFIEDINKDKNSFWITSDENINFSAITVNKDHHLKGAIQPPSKYDGNQIFFNSDRFVVNAKLNEIQLFSNLGTSICTNGYFSLDTVKNINISTKDSLTIESKNKFDFKNSSGTFIDSPKILLGKNAAEPIVLGNKLVSILENLIDIILKETHPTGTGPSGPPINSADYIKIKQKLKTILSSQNKTL